MSTLLQPHKLAMVLPDMTPAEFAQLTENIRTEGQRDEIVLLDGLILDGRHRYNACVNLNIAPLVRHFDPEIDGDSPTQFVMSRNLIRRHLSTPQRAAVGAELRPFFADEAQARQNATKFKPLAVVPDAGEIPNPTTTTAPDADLGPSEVVPSFLPPPPPTGQVQTAEIAAAVMGVSASSVKTATAIQTADPATFQEVKAGAVSLAEGKKRAAKKAAKSGTVAGQDERNNVADKVREHLGEDFAKAFLAGDLVQKKGDLDDFLTLDPQEWPNIKDLLLQRWTVKKSLAFVTDKPTTDDKIGTLLVRLNASGKKQISFDLPGFIVTVKRAAEPTAAAEPATT